MAEETKEKSPQSKGKLMFTLLLVVLTNLGRAIKKLAGSVIYQKNSNQKINKSIYDALPPLHGTMLSITLGFITVFAFYAFQEVYSGKQKLYDIKETFKDICQPDFFHGYNWDRYVNEEGELNWDRVKEALWDASLMFSYVDNNRYPKREIIIIDEDKEDSEDDVLLSYWKKHGFKRDAQYILKAQIENAAKEILSLTGLILTSYPYLGQSRIKHPGVEQRKTQVNITDDNAWLKELKRRNGYLLFIWNNKKSIIELMNHHRRFNIQEQKELHERTLRQLTKQYEEKGVEVPKELISKMKEHETYDIDFSQVILRFFSRIEYFEKEIVPKAQKQVNTISRHQEYFKLKTRAKIALRCAILIFVFGIIYPMLISADIVLPLIKRTDVVLLVITAAPYLLGLLYLIRVVARLG